MAFIDLNVRFSAGSAYLASCPGQKLRSSSTQSAEFAAQSLARKLHPGAVITDTECVKAGGTVGGTEVWRCHLQFAGGR